MIPKQRGCRVRRGVTRWPGALAVEVPGDVTLDLLIELFPTAREEQRGFCCRAVRSEREVRPIPLDAARQLAHEITRARRAHRRSGRHPALGDLRQILEQ